MSAPASAAATHAAERVRGVVGEPVEEVLGVVDHALALADEERDRLGDHPQVLLAVDLHDLLEVKAPRSCRRSCRRARPTPRARAAPDRRRPASRGDGSSRTPRSARAGTTLRRAARTARAPSGSSSGSPPRSGRSRARRADARPAASRAPRATCPPPASRRVGSCRRAEFRIGCRKSTVERSAYGVRLTAAPHARLRYTPCSAPRPRRATRRSADRGRAARRRTRAGSRAVSGPGSPDPIV